MIKHYGKQMQTYPDASQNCKIFIEFFTQHCLAKEKTKPQVKHFAFKLMPFHILSSTEQDQIFYKVSQITSFHFFWEPNATSDF